MEQILLPWHDQQTEQVLQSGVFDNRSCWVAAQHSSAGITFIRLSEPKPSLIWRLFKAIRAISLTATFMPALVALLLLLSIGEPINWGNAIFSVMAVMLLQISVNVFNDVADYKKLIDLPHTLGGSGVIQQAWLTVKQMQFMARLALIIGLICGLPALLAAPVPILICGLCAIIGVLGYSGWPFYFKYNGLGDVIVWLLCGPVLIAGISYAAVGYFPWLLLILGVFFGFAAVTILNANNINDMQLDLACGAHTLAAKLGFHRARAMQCLYYLGVILAILLLGQLHQYWLWLPLLGVPLIWAQLRVLYGASHGGDERLRDIRFNAAKLHLLLGVLMSIAITLSIWLP